jgi:hypothetical protein
MLLCNEAGICRIDFEPLLESIRFGLLCQNLFKHDLFKEPMFPL